MVLCHLLGERSFRQAWCDLILGSSIKLFQLRPNEGKGPVKAQASESTLEIPPVVHPSTASLLQHVACSLVAAAHSVFLLGGQDVPAVSFRDLFAVISKRISSLMLPKDFSRCLEMYYWVFWVAGAGFVLWFGFLVFFVSPPFRLFQSPSHMPHNSPTFYVSYNLLIVFRLSLNFLH